jgi:hypothetical protein
LNQETICTCLEIEMSSLVASGKVFAPRER